MSLLNEHPFPQFVTGCLNRHPFLYGLSAHRINMNISLYAIWFALNGFGRLRRPEYKKILVLLQPWHEGIIQPLQQVSDLLNKNKQIQNWVDQEVKVANEFERQILADTFTLEKKNRRNQKQQLLDACHNIITYYRFTRIVLTTEIHQFTRRILEILFAEEASIIENLYEKALNTSHFDESESLQLSLI